MKYWTHYDAQGNKTGYSVKRRRFKGVKLFIMLVGVLYLISAYTSIVIMLLGLIGIPMLLVYRLKDMDKPRLFTIILGYLFIGYLFVNNLNDDSNLLTATPTYLDYFIWRYSDNQMVECLELVDDKCYLIGANDIETLNEYNKIQFKRMLEIE